MSDLVQLELIRESLVAIVNEMRANVIRSSYSSIIYEGHDFSCALMTADGRQAAQSLADLPLHIFPVPYSTRAVVQAFKDDIHDGDIFLHNDPYTGGTHLNDILMLQPVFADGRLLLFTAVRCHWGDVGGMTPGSLSGRVREIYQEGIRIVPTRIAARGVLNTAFLDLLFNNMRVPSERRGDFNTMLGTGRKAAEQVQRLARRFGPSGLVDGIDEIIRRAEVQMRARIRALPDGEYRAEGYIESDGHSNDPLVARVAITIAGDTLTADFTGTSGQSAGPMNVGPAMVMTAIGSIVKSFLDPKTPINHGSFQPIRIVAPENSFINARLPAPCGGMAEVKYLMDSVCAAAMGRALPEMRVGDLRGTSNHNYITGPSPRGDRLFIQYEYPSGGTAASRGIDGSHACRNYLEGDFNSIQSTEVIESQTPLRVERCILRQGSCGDGEYRGGLGMIREFRILGEGAQLSVLSDRNVIPPYGVEGARSSAANRFTVVRDGAEVQTSPVPGKVSGFAFQPGDLFRVETAGGGGYGDPLRRAPERVGQDVRLGYLSAEQARRRFGVVLAADGTPDGAASEALRAEIAGRRVFVSLRLGDDLVEGTRRYAPLAPSLMDRLGIGPGDMLELVTGVGAPLRAWARPAGAGVGDDRSIAIGPVGLGLLDARPGDTIELRRLRPLPDA